MILLIAINLLIGAMLGLRFRVLVLLPSTFAAVIVTLSVGVENNETARTVLFSLILAAAALQAGYFAGANLTSATAAFPKSLSWREAWRARHASIL